MNTATPIPEMNPALETNIGYHTWDLAAGKRQWAKNGEDGGTPQHAYPLSDEELVSRLSARAERRALPAHRPSAA